MKINSKLTYTQKIKWRIWVLRGLILFLIAYMILIGELGGGDSRVQTRLADFVGDVIVFGGILYSILRIAHNKKLLHNRLLLKEQARQELDERNQYLHDKSGGIVLDILLFFLLIITATCAMFHMIAFYVSLSILAAALILKLAAYQIYSRRS